MRNPNTLRRTRLASTVALLAAGTIACTGKSVPPPETTPPPETVDNKPVEDPPACTSITATPDTTAPHTMKIKLETTDNVDDTPAIWFPDHAEYNFGDGTPEASDALSTLHTYPSAGTFTVNATIVMDVAVQDAPFRGETLRCPSTPITVP